MNNQGTLGIFFTLSLLIPHVGLTQEISPQKVRITDEVALHYVERGAGEPIIFVHGLTGDYMIWAQQLEAFAREGFRAISYSRRYNFPNKNQLHPDHSASIEADDLAALIRELGLKKAHLVGHSYGAYTALILSLRNPELVHTVTLAEPPVIPWLADLPGDQAEAGRMHMNKLMKEGVEPAKKAFEEGQDEQGMRTIFDFIAGKPLFNRLPEFVKRRCRRNIKEVKAIMTSNVPYPDVDRERVRRSIVPTLILSGSESRAAAKFTDVELDRLLPDSSSRRVVLPGATHNMWLEQPVPSRRAVLGFIRGK